MIMLLTGLRARSSVHTSSTFIDATSSSDCPFSALMSPQMYCPFFTASMFLIWFSTRKARRCLTVSGTHFSPTGIHPPKLSMLGILTKKSSQPSRRPLVQWPCLGHGIQLGRTASQIVVLLTSKSNMSTNRLNTIFFVSSAIIQHHATIFCYYQPCVPFPLFSCERSQ